MLSLRSKAGFATFSWSDGPMKAEWVLRDGMTEEEIMSALALMVRFVRQQPADAQVIEMPLHVVANDDDNVADFTEAQRRMPRSMGMYKGPMPEPAPMTWTPVVQPKPLEDSIMAAQASGFEPIPPDEMDD